MPLSERENFRKRPHHHLVRGHVYFISKGDAIKIGYSANPSERLAALQMQHSESLVILAAAPGTVRHERTLHQRFEALKITGEWFRPAPELTDFIEHVRKTGSTKFTEADAQRILKKQLQSLAQKHRGNVVVTSRVHTLVSQIDNMAKSRGDPDRVAWFRDAIAKTTESLAQVIRDGGQYVPENHPRARFFTQETSQTPLAISTRRSPTDG